MKESKHSNPFLESGCRCEICDNFGTRNIPVKFPYVCDDCKKKKTTALYLRKERIEGLIALYIKKLGESWTTFKFDFDNLENQRNELIEIESKLKQAEDEVAETSVKGD